jgi:hydrogenase expression/formation protein HypC
MCLTIPGRVVELVSSEPGDRKARVDFGGTVKTAHLVYAPEVKVGDYVIVQAGFVVRRLGEQEALEALEYTRQIDALGAPAAPPTDGRAAHRAESSA